MDRLSQLPYQSLAPIYDYVMQHVDYDEWAAFIQEIFLRYAPRSNRIIDIACGTGNISMELGRLGFNLTGVDLSKEMVNVAKQKAELDGCDCDFFHRDLRDLTGLGPFEGAVCMYDSFNYLLDTNDIDEALAQIWDILTPDGLFIFDVCTELNSKQYFDGTNDKESGPGFKYIRNCFYDAKNHLQYNNFEVQFDGDQTLYTEKHIQRIYPLIEIEQRIINSNFTLVDSLAEYTFNPGTENASRVHYVLKANRDET